MASVVPAPIDAEGVKFRVLGFWALWSRERFSGDLYDGPGFGPPEKTEV